MPLVHHHRGNSRRPSVLQDGGASVLPFGKEVEYGGGVPSALANIVWLIFGGIFLALEALVNGVILCITIVGIPFGLQCFKQAKLALMPFGAEVLPKS